MMCFLLSLLLPLFASCEQEPITVSLAYTFQGLEITLNNTLDQDVYLFDTYLNDDLFVSKYTHLYDPQNESMIISFLPLLPYLGGMKPDVIRVGRDIVNKGFYTYHFTTIPKQGSITFRISYEAFESKECMQYINVSDYSKFDTSIPFHAYESISTLDSIFIELAIYNRVDLLLDDKAYWNNEIEFNTQAQEYVVVRIPICRQPLDNHGF